MRYARAPRGLLTAITLSFTVALIGCDGDDPAEDAGMTPTDGGPTTETDGGPTSETDGGPPPEPDGGPPPMPDAGPPDAGPTDPTRCTTEIDPEDDTVGLELCAPEDGPVRHVRLEGFVTPGGHATAAVFFGLDAPPTSGQSDLEADQLRVLFYAGSTPAPPPQAAVRFGDVGRTLFAGPPANFIRETSTVCFDVHDGSETTAPYVVLWVDGESGADCDDRDSLTLESAYAMELAFERQYGAVDKTQPVYLYRFGTANVASATLSTVAALTPEQAHAGLECASDWVENNDWQSLCRPAAGVAQHLRLEGIDAPGPSTSRYFYLLTGGDEAPPASGQPPAAPGRFILSGGRTHPMGPDGSASWTWFRFGDESTTQFRYPDAESEAPLYLSGPTTVCLDLTERSTTEGPVTDVLFWASGVNEADCADPATLTVERALYDSAIDPDAQGMWEAALDANSIWLRASSTEDLSIDRVVLAREPAVYR